MGCCINFMVITKRLVWQCSRPSWQLVSEESSWSLGKRLSFVTFCCEISLQHPSSNNKNTPRLHWWFMNSSALGTFSWLNLVAWDIATSKISKHLVPRFLYLCIHPGVHQNSVHWLQESWKLEKQMPTLPTIRSFTSLDHVKTEPWQWESKGRMKLPLSKTYWYIVIHLSLLSCILSCRISSWIPKYPPPQQPQTPNPKARPAKSLGQQCLT